MLSKTIESKRLMTRLRTLSQAVRLSVTNYGLGSSNNEIPWGNALFLTDENMEVLPRSHLRRHLLTRNEDAKGPRLHLAQRLQASVERELEEKRRIEEGMERRHREIADLEEQGAVYCVGSNHRGQLGMGDLDHRIVFTALPMSRGIKVTQVSTRNDLVFAVTASHEVYCWGSSGIGPMAIECRKKMSDFESPQRVVSLDEEDILSVIPGANHGCALNKTSVYTWGDGQNGCLGNSNLGLQTLPDLVTFFSGDNEIQSIGVGEMHCCALSKTGRVWAWGHGANGRLGIGEHQFHKIEEGEEATVVAIPQMIPFPTQIIRMVACGSEHVMVASRSRVFSWGNNDGGRLGLGDIEDRSKPCELLTLKSQNIIDISCGTWHSSCIAAIPPLKESGRLYTWGSGYNGQLGQGIRAISMRPSIVTFFCEENIMVKSIVCGSHHNAVITSENELFTWGLNQNGCLGHDIDEEFVSFTPKPGYCPGFGAIVDRIGRGLPISVALGRGFTIVCTDKYSGPTEAEARSSLFETHPV